MRELMPLQINSMVMTSTFRSHLDVRITARRSGSTVGTTTVRQTTEDRDPSAAILQWRWAVVDAMNFGCESSRLPAVRATAPGSLRFVT
jgi:hypothetical protein